MDKWILKRFVRIDQNLSHVCELSPVKFPFIASRIKWFSVRSVVCYRIYEMLFYYQFVNNQN